MKKFGKVLMTMSKDYKLYLRKQKLYNVLVYVTQLVILLFLIGLWQYVADEGIVNTFITSSPKEVVKTIVGLYNDNNLFNHIFITVYETLISFLLGTGLGIVIAIILWYNKFIYRVVDPYLTLINSLPKVALGPILIIWIGANMNSIVVMALLISLIITIINVYNGLIATDINKINLLRSFQASKWQILKMVVLPSSYSMIISSLKINISMSLIGMYDI